MSALSETALVHNADESLPPSVDSALGRPVDAAERQIAAVELRLAFCADLKAAREHRGISLQMISEATKISESLFADFERCDVSRWPLGLYRRAFFREYAAFIGQPESTVGEFVRLFPDDLGRASGESVLVPGPLRLTLARAQWVHLSLIQAQAAVIDTAIALVGSAILAWSTAFSFGAAVGIVALGYYAIATVVFGRSFGAWWMRGGKHAKRPRTLYLAR